MHFPTRYFALVSVTTAISLLTVSCAESKVSQCNKIIQVANKAVNETKSVTNNGQSSDPKVYLQVANAMQKASQDMQAINVNDEKLKDYQAGFIKIYGGSSKATREYIAALDKKDRPAAEKALDNLLQATTPEQKLVTDINTYCSNR